MNSITIPTVTRVAMKLYPERGLSGWDPPVTLQQGIDFFKKEETGERNKI
jgi:hypothetical protein